MKRSHHFTALAALAIALAPAVQAQPLVNLGLVGVGRVPADTLDSLGMDSLGGVFSGVWFDPASLSKSGDTYSAVLFATPDRGFGNSTTAYHPRLQRLAFSITPYYGPGPVAQDQITFANTGTMLFSVGGDLFTGFDPDDTNFVAHPRTLASGLGGGLWSLDPEGVVRAPDGTWYISDEYGPFLYQFDATGALLDVLVPPDAYLPKLGPTYPRAINYLAASTIATNDSGRYINRGFEGATITPDGMKLVTVLQSPLVQDGQNRNPSRNTRILVFDLDPLSVTYHQPVAEYVHVLPLSAAEANNRHTPVSEILALSATKFLILQRDGRGLGGDPGAFLYKRIVEVNGSAASNLIGTGYDLEKGAPGQLSLPRSGLPAGVVAVTSRDLVDIINPTQLAKYGLNLASSNQNANTICEKWEGMAVIPLNDPAAPDDYLLLIGNDNDFKAGLVYHNGLIVGTNDVVVDNFLLAFRIGADSTPPTLVCPATLTVAASTNCTLPGITSRVTATDNSAAPITLTQSPAAGSAVTLGVPVNVTVTARDAAGNNSAPCTIAVTVTDQTPPKITVPANILATNDAGQCSAVVSFSATASDNCGVVTVFTCTPPSGSAFPKGTNVLSCTATDNAANTSTASFKVTVVDKEAPVILGVTPSRDQLWPPKGNLALVTMTVNVTDNCDVPVCEIIEVTSSDPVTGPDDATTPDWEITGPLRLNLRAERLESTPGRIYTITIRCTDSSRNSSTKSVTVTVPHDQRKKG